MADEKKIIAPKSIEDKEVSFETFFLRKLYSEGEFTKKDLEDLTKDSLNKEDVLKAIQNIDGKEITKDIATSISKIAKIVSSRN